MIFIKTSFSYIASVIFFAVIVILVCALFSVIGFIVSGEGVPAMSEIPIMQKPASKKVVIDAGHGGRDSGTVAENGVTEKEINLDVAKKIASFLRAEDVEVILTRETDEMLVSEENTATKKESDLKRRVEIASKYPDALFVSIHQNAIPFPECRGLQVFYSDNSPLSQILAENVRKAVKEKLLPTNKREIKKAGTSIYVLDRIKSPAILIECGFLSNSEEATLLCDPVYRTKLAFVIASCIVDFLQ